MNGDNRRKRPAPISIRVTEAERARLKSRAGNRPLGTYIKQTLFGDEAVTTAPARAVSVDHILIARVLAQLGLSGIAASLAVLAREAASGNLFEDDATAARLRSACEDVRTMRETLLRALGKRSVQAEGNTLEAVFNRDAMRPEDRP